MVVRELELDIEQVLSAGRRVPAEEELEPGAGVGELGVVDRRLDEREEWGGVDRVW